MAGIQKLEAKAGREGKIGYVRKLNGLVQLLANIFKNIFHINVFYIKDISIGTPRFKNTKFQK